MSMLAEGSLESPCSLWTKHSINSLGLRKLEENRMSYHRLRGKRGQARRTGPTESKAPHVKPTCGAPTPKFTSALCVRATRPSLPLQRGHWAGGPGSFLFFPLDGIHGAEHSTPRIHWGVTKRGCPTPEFILAVCVRATRHYSYVGDF